MKTSYYLATAAVLAAAAGAVYTGLPAAATPLPPTVPLAPADMPALPPIVLGPNETPPVAFSEPPKAPPPVVPAGYVRGPTPPPLPPAAGLLPPPSSPQIPAPLPAVPLLPAVPPPPGPVTLPPAALLAVPPPSLAPLVPPPVTPVSALVGPPPVLPAVPPPGPTPATPAPRNLVLPAVPPPGPAPATPAPGPFGGFTPPSSPGTPGPVPPGSPDRVKPGLPAVPPPELLPAPTPVPAPVLPSVGTIVVLQDGKLVEGTVTKSGDKVIVRKGAVDQPFAADKVQYIGTSKDDVYRFMLGKVKPDDAAGRLRVARWCMFNGLREQALGEAREVVRLQPTNTAAADMARALDESLRLFPADGSAPKPVTPATPAAPGLPVVPPPVGLGGPPATPPPFGGVAPPGLPGPSQPPPVVVEPEQTITPEAAVAFAPRVQPVLTNLCADCHARPGYTGAFKLARDTGFDADPHVTRQNLRAAAAQLRKDDPAASPLLTRALCAHGGMKQPAFVGRHAPAFRVLEAWAFVAVGSSATPAPVPPVPPPPTGVPAVAPMAVPPTLPPTPSTGDLPPPDVRLALPPVPGPDAKPVLPPVPPPDVRPMVPPVLPPAPPPIPPATDGVKPVRPVPVAPYPLPVPPPIPRAAEMKFGQDAAPLPVSMPPNPANTGDAVDEFDPSTYNREASGGLPGLPPLTGVPVPGQLPGQGTTQK
ncbi:MAG: hypothetical protein JWO38_4733 [Gemmataceae bacterium]|nr:hypothetical protein [Gemmataceae bacterium]